MPRRCRRKSVVFNQMAGAHGASKHLFRRDAEEGGAFLRAVQKIRTVRSVNSRSGVDFQRFHRWFPRVGRRQFQATHCFSVFQNQQQRDLTPRVLADGSEAAHSSLAEEKTHPIQRMNEQIRQHIAFRIGAGKETIVVTVHRCPAQFLPQAVGHRRKTALKTHCHGTVARTLRRFDQAVELFERGAGRFLHKERFPTLQYRTGDGKMGRRRRRHEDTVDFLVVEHFAQRGRAAHAGVFPCHGRSFARRRAANGVQLQA